jgi:hypothetical protein
VCHFITLVYSVAQWYCLIVGLLTNLNGWSLFSLVTYRILNVVAAYLQDPFWVYLCHNVQVKIRLHLLFTHIGKGHNVQVKIRFYLLFTHIGKGKSGTPSDP